MRKSIAVWKKLYTLEHKLTYEKRCIMIHGFLKVAAATPECTVGDCGANTASILALIREAAAQNVSLVVFPELCITGYTCGDLFSQELLCRVSLAAVRLVAEKTRDIPVTSVVGFPFFVQKLALQLRGRHFARQDTRHCAENQHPELRRVL